LAVKTTVESSLKLLNEMVARIGLAGVSEKIGYSKSAICHVQRGTYRGKADKVLEAARRAFDTSAVSCPALGEISFARCIEERNRPFAAVNPLRVMLARTCRTCEQGGNNGQ
jgi:hypothetical protein